MPYRPEPDPTAEPNCVVCCSASNQEADSINKLVSCARCGDFQISRDTIGVIGLPYNDLKERALASYNIRKLQPSEPAPILTTEFFKSLKHRNLPSPAEASDNLIIWIAEQANGSLNRNINIENGKEELLARVGVVESGDLHWMVKSLQSKQLFTCGDHFPQGTLTIDGWNRVQELKRAHVSSKYAFFARQFTNPDLDMVFGDCLRPAVKATGYELRTVTQRAGLVDAVIEDEIRRCRFLIADLSDDNAGAYWEAGFAEGLAKPVIYVCRADARTTHFDTNHRHTITWDLASLDQTATKLKAVIRNTLLGDAKQTDG